MQAFVRFVLTILLVVAGTSEWAHAQGAVSLTATRAISELSVAPGGNVSETVTLSNSSNQPLTVIAAVGDVVPSGNGFALSESSTADSAAAWVTVTPSSVEVPPASTSIVTVSVRAPAGVPVGQHSAGVLFSSGPRAQSLHTILVTVTGEGLRRDAVVDSIAMPKFEIRGRVPFTITVTNSGNTHAVIEGKISVLDRLRRTETTIEVPRFYAMPGRRSTTFIVEWDDPPPILFARVRAQLSLRYETPLGIADAQTATTTGISLAWWALGLALALVILIIRLVAGLFSRRRRRARRSRAARPPAPRPTTGAELPPPVPGGSPVMRTGRSAWAGEPAHTSAAGAIAVRRAGTAIRMLREGAGKSGVRPDVAVGLLRSVQDLPEVRDVVETAYEDASVRKAVKETSALALALAVVESPHAPEALLRAYAKADRVLAARIRRALAQCDPADLRALPDLLEALPSSRRDVLPVR